MVVERSAARNAEETNNALRKYQVLDNVVSQGCLEADELFFAEGEPYSGFSRPWTQAALARKSNILVRRIHLHLFTASSQAALGSHTCLHARHNCG